MTYLDLNDVMVKLPGGWTLFDDVTFRVPGGQRAALVGANGVGKTTLLRMIAGFIEPTAGRIVFEPEGKPARDVTDTPPNKRNTGMVFQSYALWPHMTVAQNVAFGLSVRKVPAAERDRRALIGAALELARRTSSLHVLFPPEDEARLLEESGLMLRRTVQFHWRNDGYADFDDFTARLSHARRKNMRQERRRVREAGVELRWLEGTGIERRHWEFFNRCYRGTYRAHRSSPYLNLDFFLRIGAALRGNVAMVIAERSGGPIASSLFLFDAKNLYGRYWGALEHVPLLHFECCYYQAIDFAIRKKLEVFEGGAQGEHKIFRGLMPVETLSAHWLAHPRFARAIEQFLEREGAGIARYVDELRDHSPFRQEEK